MDENGKLASGKVPTTPADRSIGVVKSVESAAQSMGMKLEDVLQWTELFAQSSTTGINALLTRTGAKVGLITTKGFEDTILIMRAKGRHDGLPENEIKRIIRTHTPEPLVPRPLIKGIVERTDSRGKIVVPLDRASVEQAVKELLDKGAEAIAVSLLWSPANPRHEKEVQKIIHEMYPELFVSISSDVAPVVGEYERTATTVVNVYVGQIINRYHKRLNDRLKERGSRITPVVMQCYGGCVSLEESEKQPIGNISSGPAGGLMASKFLAELLGYRNVITADVGGTSFDVGIIANGEPELNTEPVIGQYAIRTPMLDSESIGAGGGSIAWIEPISNLLKVGPQSAAAVPGPACYDTGGTEPTLTDCNIVLGYLNPDYFLGGRMKINKDKGITAIKRKIADPLGMTVEEAAAGVFRIITAQMSDLIRSQTVGKGYDPKDFIIFAYGGAGPLHASSFGREAQAILVPNTCSVHSAMGVLTSDFMHAYQLGSPRMIPVEPAWFTSIFKKLERKAFTALKQEGFKPQDVSIQRIVDMRYALQMNEVRTPVPDGDLTEKDLARVWDEFERLYEKQFGKGAGYREAGIQVVTFRVEARSSIKKPSLVKLPEAGKDSSHAVKTKRKIFLPNMNRFQMATIYDGNRLRPGNVVYGPAIIEHPMTTILIDEDMVGKIDGYLNTLIAKRA